MRRAIRRSDQCVALLAVLAVGGCAARAVPPEPLTATPLAGRYVTGTIVAVRDAGTAQGTLGLGAVLAALNQPAGNGAAAQEIVIRRADNSVTTLVQSPAPGDAGFHAGERVAIITAATTVVKRE